MVKNVSALSLSRSPSLYVCVCSTLQECCTVCVVIRGTRDFTTTVSYTSDNMAPVCWTSGSLLTFRTSMFISWVVQRLELGCRCDWKCSGCADDPSRLYFCSGMLLRSARSFLIPLPLWSLRGEVCMLSPLLRLSKTWTSSCLETLHHTKVWLYGVCVCVYPVVLWRQAKSEMREYSWAIRRWEMFPPSTQTAQHH